VVNQIPEIVLLSAGLSDLLPKLTPGPVRMHPGDDLMNIRKNNIELTMRHYIVLATKVKLQYWKNDRIG
jgi:hypothetical protein